MKDFPVIDRIREVRRKISEEHGHDTERLVRHYQEMGKKSFFKCFASPLKSIPDQILPVILFHNETPSCSTTRLNGKTEYRGEYHSSRLLMMLLNTVSVSSSRSYMRSRILVMMCQGNETGRGDVGKDQPIKGEGISAISVLEQ